MWLHFNMMPCFADMVPIRFGISMVSNHECQFSCFVLHISNCTKPIPIVPHKPTKTLQDNYNSTKWLTCNWKASTHVILFPSYNFMDFVTPSVYFMQYVK